MSKELEKIIDYHFNDVELLETALTHSSMQKSHVNNERLEFLGDRVLGLAVADTLYIKFNKEDEGKLAKRHTALVRRDALFIVAENINIEKFIKLSVSEKKSGGLKKKTILSNTIEAIIGAIYVDGGYSEAYKFVEKFWKEMLNNQEVPPEDAKSSLQEWAQSRSLPLPTYKLIKKVGNDHSPEFEIECFVEKLGSTTATASSKKKAEKLCAIKLLEKIKKEQQNG